MSGMNVDGRSLSSTRERYAALGQIKQTQAWHVEMFEKPLLNVLPFELRQLFCGHLTPVRHQRAIHFAAHRKQRFFVRVRRKRSRKLFFKYSQASFEIFEVERAG